MGTIFLDSSQLILSQNLVGTIAAAAKAVASLLLSDDDDVWRLSMGDICKCEQYFWSLHNSFFHKM